MKLGLICSSVSFIAMMLISTTEGIAAPKEKVAGPEDAPFVRASRVAREAPSSPPPPPADDDPSARLNGR